MCLCVSVYMCLSVSCVSVRLSVWLCVRAGGCVWVDVGVGVAQVGVGSVAVLVLDLVWSKCGDGGGSWHGLEVDRYPWLLLLLKKC